MEKPELFLEQTEEAVESGPDDVVGFLEPVLRDDGMEADFPLGLFVEF